MYQTPMTVWNAIAKGQPLSKPWSILFKMTSDELPQGLDALVNQPIKARGADAQTVLAYGLVAPLLIENVAISAYVNRVQDPSLRAVLPEIKSVGDAIMFASVEHQLTTRQQAQLKKLLITTVKG